MSLFILIIIFVLGTCVGSFLNVVGLRFHSGLTLGGRSFCPHCRKTLNFWELVPVASFLFLRGRCSSCGAKISWQYPLVEGLTGLVFVSIFNLYLPVINSLLLLLVFCLYLVIVIYDWRHLIIPDALVFSAIGLSLVLRLFVVHGSILDLLAGSIFFAAFALVWLFSKGRAMGFGDAKLVLSIGFLLGWPLGLSAVVLSFWIGSVVSVCLLLSRRKGLTMKSEIPFAPFLCLGAWLALIFHLDLFHVLTF